jgi:hypothetical protein
MPDLSSGDVVRITVLGGGAKLDRTFEVFADYFQFLVQDSGSDWEDLADRWTPEAVQAMFIQGDGYVAIGTARNMNVPVTVRIRAEEPSLDPEEWDRVVQGALVLRSGELQITGVSDNGMSGGKIPIERGEYHLRALYAGLNSLSANGLSGNDRYVIELWPVAPGSPTT